MDLLNGKIRPMYGKYLSAAFGSAMITSVYSIVDTAMVGQYHGPEGTAALAVVAPVWNIIYSLVLPVLAGASSIWFAMPITELLVMVYAASAMGKATRKLPQEPASAGA